MLPYPAMEARRQDLVNSIGLLVLRVGVGVYLATHGWGKLQMVLDGSFDKFTDPIGIGSGPSLVLVTLAEFVCALLVALGLVTRLAAIGPVVAMSIAAFVVHGSDPWTMQEAARIFRAGEADSWSSKEPALLYLIPFLALVFTGPGRLSLDAWLWPRLRRS